MEDISYITLNKINLNFFSACDCFPNNLTLCRIHPLNLLSPGFPEYCDNLNCSTNIYLESPFITNDYAECLQIQFNSFLNEVDKDLLHLKIPLGVEETKLISYVLCGFYGDNQLNIL